jgi:hypothetical protein
MHKICQAVIAGVAVLLASERSPAQTLSHLPPMVAEEIRGGEQACRNHKMRPVYRLNEVVHQHSLSGRGSRDYIVDPTKLRCRERGGFMSHAAVMGGNCGSGGCGISVFLQPRHGQWVAQGFLVTDWHVIRRPGKKTLLVIGIRCYGSAPECRTRNYSTVVRVSRDGSAEEGPAKRWRRD